MMLRFVFAALVVALDQLFKRWIVVTLEVGERGPEIIPGVLGLTHLENDGAMLNILSGQQWLLAGIAFVVSVALVMILLRYNEGFVGTLGLSAVLGGAVGNLIDRIFNDGSVIDMFQTLFINFPIFNFADVFITLGFAMFLIHFIALSFRADNEAGAVADEYAYEEVPEESDGQVYDEFPDIDAVVATKAEQRLGLHEEFSEDGGTAANASAAQYDEDDGFADIENAVSLRAQQDLDPAANVVAPEPVGESVLPSVELPSDYDSITETTPDIGFSLDNLQSELDSISADDYDIDDLLREYGSKDNEEDI